jgi:hypothetical protein
MLKFVRKHGIKLLGFHGLPIYLINKMANVGQGKGHMEMLVLNCGIQQPNYHQGKMLPNKKRDEK